MEYILEASALTRVVSAPEGKLEILGNINLSLQAGDSLAIVGPSGSGKSTLLALLAGLDLPSSGAVRLLGAELNTLSEDQRARLRGSGVGFVFQNFQLLPQLSALENVAVALELRNLPDAKRVATHWLQQVGLADRARHLPVKMSGGEQQRVAIARAFAGAPKILFADEPTGNLDATTGRQIADLLFDLNAAQGTTLVLVTHDLALAARCRRRLILHAGRMVEEVAA
jgi:putative ABC transport system ATP-binding protein